MQKKLKQQSNVSRGEYRKVIRSLATISESLELMTKTQINSENSRNKRQDIISLISLIIALVSAIISIISLQTARTQWEKSGPQFSYVTQTGGDNHWTIIYNNTIHKQKTTTPVSILLSNTGRLKATVLSVSVEDNNHHKYDNLCRQQEVTIESGETKLVIALFNKMQLPITKVSVLTADAQKVDAKKQEHSDSDLAVKSAIDYAFRQGNQIDSSGQYDNSSDDSGTINPNTSIVCDTSK